MKATGIVRRIDELGRVVVPKEIRRTLRIREGDPLEIFTDNEGEIILKKFSPIGELSVFSEEYAESLAKSAGYTVCITDKEQVIAAAGAGKRQLLTKTVSLQLESAMEAREEIVASAKEDSFRRIVEGQEEEYLAQAIAPILSDGDVVGSVILLTKDTNKKFGDTEMMLVRTAATFLGKQMEQ